MDKKRYVKFLLILIFIIFVIAILFYLFPKQILEGILKNETGKQPLEKIVMPNATKIEQLIYQRFNEERGEKGLVPLNYSQNYSELAREHSQDMITNNYFNTTDLQGRIPIVRALNKSLNTYIACYGTRVYLYEAIGNCFISSEEDASNCALVLMSKKNVEDMIMWTSKYGGKCNYPRDMGVGVACKGNQCLVTLDML